MRSLSRIVILICAISTTLALGSGPSRATDQQLEELKAKGKALGWTFDVGYNEVMDYPMVKPRGSSRIRIGVRRPCSCSRKKHGMSFPRSGTGGMPPGA